MGYYAKHQDGTRWWHEDPESERCGGSGYMHCYCGGDFCVCGNQGEIECMGCEDCEGDEDDDPDADLDFCGRCGKYIGDDLDLDSLCATCEKWLESQPTQVQRTSE